MPNKDLLVLAECVDIRNGRRFTRGQYFDPTPTGEQALRLVAAKCLPPAAIKLGDALDARLAKEAEDAAALADKIAQRNATIAAAVDADAVAQLALENARKRLADAISDADKAEAAKAVQAAETAAAAASDNLAKAQK